MIYKSVVRSSDQGASFSRGLGGESSRSSSSGRPGPSAFGDLSSHSTRCDVSCMPVPVLRATALVNVVTAGGRAFVIRASLDLDSEASFVSESLVQRLRLPRAFASVTITGIGAKSAVTSRGRVSIRISLRVSSSFELDVDALILPQLTSYAPPDMVSGVSWPHLAGLAFADPDLSSGLRVELLLGADIFSHVLLPGVMRGPSGSLVAQNTHLGWTLSGGVDSRQDSGSVRTSSQFSVDDSLSVTLQRFWDQEELLIPSPVLDASERECEDHFARTYSRNHEGRYIVHLPIKESLTEFGDLFAAANSFHACWHLLVRMHSDFLTEYEGLNHIELVLRSTEDPSLVYYLPHHGVIRQSRSTTKLRVVFNESQKTTLGISLNENLHTGPTLLLELFDVILRWRRHKVVFSAGMEKMYGQVLLHPDDCNMQRILWRTSSNTQPTKYRLKTVTYGLTCAPFLAIRVIRQLALDER